MTADDLNAALAQEWCNGCGKPRALWGPICGGMTQGDWTHYHSPGWWQRRFLAAECDGSSSCTAEQHIHGCFRDYGRARHNHRTRVLKTPGRCPGCDEDRP